MKNIKRIIFYIFFVAFVISLPTTSFAHSGRTDSSGGHHDYKNKSGLGSYHYHHGMGPHLHPGGVCPYSGSGNSESSSNSYTPPSPSISIISCPDTLNVGDSAGFEYSVSNATSDNNSVVSSDTSVVSIGANNTLKAESAGTAQITIKASGTTKTFTVKVVAVPVEEVKISNATDKIQLGENYKFETVILPKNATNKKVIWSSDNTDVLEIDNAGNIQTKSTGIATITALADNNIESKITVEVFEIIPNSIECNDSINLIVGDKEDYKINVLPNNANNKELKISCDDENILKYSQSSVEAVSEGETILHIETWNGIKKDIPVKVDIIPVEQIEIKDATNYMFSNIIDKSSEILVSTNIVPNNATYQDVEWSSSNNAIIEIDNGKFIIKNTGKVTLTCIAHGDVKNSISITVINKYSIIIFSSLFITGTIVVVAISVFYIKKKHKNREQNCKIEE